MTVTSPTRVVSLYTEGDSLPSYYEGSESPSVYNESVSLFKWINSIPYWTWLWTFRFHWYSDLPPSTESPYTLITFWIWIGLRPPLSTSCTPNTPNSLSALVTLLSREVFGYYYTMKSFTGFCHNIVCIVQYELPLCLRVQNDFKQSYFLLFFFT